MTHSENDLDLNYESQAESHNFTIILNDAIRDPRLSWRAKGILAGCLSHSRGFQFNKAWIISHGTEGRDAVSGALKELREFGYLESRVERCKVTGRVTGERLVFMDRATNQNHRRTENPDAGKPATGKPATGKPVVLRRPIEENQKKENQEIKQAAPSVPEGWQTLPPRPARKSKKFVAVKESVPIKLQAVALSICNFFNNHKGGQKTQQAFDGLITNLIRIADDPGGGIGQVKKQLDEAIARSEMGEKKWVSITYANWEKFGKDKSVKTGNGNGWAPINNRPSTERLVSKFEDDQPAALVL